MKGLSLLSLALMLSGVFLASGIRAQDHTRWRLPDGAIARFGKGNISNGDRAIAYSPDGRRIAVAGNIGVWIYDAHTGAELALLTGHPSSVTSWRFRLTETHGPAAVGRRSDCGT